jgi:hypothetical protein
MAKVKRFKAKLGGEEQGGIFIEIPFDPKAAFGRARPPVKATLNRYQYRSTLSVYGGKAYLPVRKSNREAAGVKVGETISVTLELDEDPREVEIPEPLAEALAKNRAARAAWDKLSFTHKREHADAILSAKKPETRAGRVAKAVEMLLAKAAATSRR